MTIKISDKIICYCPEFHKDFATYSIRVINQGNSDLVDIDFHLMFRKYPQNKERVSVTYPLFRKELLYLSSQGKNLNDAYWNITLTMFEKDGMTFKQYLKSIKTSLNIDKIFEEIKTTEIKLQKGLTQKSSLSPLVGDNKLFDKIELLVKGTDIESNKIYIEKKEYKINDIILGHFDKPPSLNITS